MKRYIIWAYHEPASEDSPEKVESVVWALEPDFDHKHAASEIIDRSMDQIVQIMEVWVVDQKPVSRLVPVWASALVQVEDLDEYLKDMF